MITSHLRNSETHSGSDMRFATNSRVTGWTGDCPENSRSASMWVSSQPDDFLRRALAVDSCRTCAEIAQDFSQISSAAHSFCPASTDALRLRRGSMLSRKTHDHGFPPGSVDASVRCCGLESGDESLRAFPALGFLVICGCCKCVSKASTTRSFSVVLRFAATIFARSRISSGRFRCRCFHGRSIAGAW